MGTFRRGLQTSRRCPPMSDWTPRLDPDIDMWYAADTNATISGGKVVALGEITGRNFAQIKDPNNISTASWNAAGISSRTTDTITDSLGASPILHYLNQGLVGSLANVPLTTIFEVKAGTLGYINVGYSGGPAYGCDIANGVSLAPSYTYADIGGGWKRFSITSNPFAGVLLIVINNAYTNTLAYQGTGTGTVSIRNIQVFQQGQLIQGTDGNRGSLKTDARYGGRTVLDMTGSVYMVGNPPGRNQPYAYYFVGNVLDATTLHYALGSTGGVVSFTQLSANGGVSLSAGTALTAAGNASTPGIYVASTNGASSAVYLRSLAAGASGNAGAGALNTGSIYLGSSATPNGYNGDSWAELIGCRSATINPRIMQYLARKYSLSLT